MNSKNLNIILVVIVVVLLAVVGALVTKDRNTQSDQSNVSTTNDTVVPNSNTNIEVKENINTQKPATYNYVNPDYGFRLTLGNEWADYKVFKGSNTTEVYYSFCMKTNDLTYGSDPSVGKGYACPFSVSVMSNESWIALDALDRERLEPTVIANKGGNKYIFSVWQDAPSDMQSVDFDLEAVKRSFSI